MITQLSPQQAQALLQQRPDTLLLDVREEDETQICQIANSVHIPMNLIPLRQNELPDGVAIIVYCHHGLRSLNVARFLEHAGFDELYNLAGGIEAWAQEVAPDMAIY
nr:rhodanese-like domain-containing protein [uncultured Kingella sp.]